MTEFTNVSVIREANIYYEGKITSRTILFADGSRKTLGIMMPGEYEFSTDDKEVIEILSGSLEFSLSGEEGWQAVSAGGSFEIPADFKFRVNIKELVDYCCSYLAD